VTEPRVWYNKPKKSKLTAASRMTRSSFATQAQDKAAQETTSRTARAVQDITMQVAQTQARHTNDEYYADQTRHWSQEVAKANPDAWLPESVVSDDEIRRTLGLPTTLNMDMFRADPSLWDRFPSAKERLARWNTEKELELDKDTEEKKNWAQKARGWIVDELKDTGIFLGEAYDMAVTKPLAIGNEMMGELFPEDATGTRQMFGHALITSGMPGVIPGEGGAPRLLTPQQIQGHVTDTLADLDVGTQEQRDRYKARIIELKAEGVTDDEARAQAFDERTDIPGWVKFGLPIATDPTTYLGGVGFVKGVGGGIVKAGKGVRTGLKVVSANKSARMQRFMGEKTDMITHENAILPELEEMGKIVDEVAAAPTGLRGRVQNLPGAPGISQALKLIDPSNALSKLKKGTAEYLLLGGRVAMGQLLDRGDRASSFIVSQAKGKFGKVDDVWGKEVLGDKREVLVQKLTQVEYKPLVEGVDETLQHGKIRKIDESWVGGRGHEYDVFDDADRLRAIEAREDFADFPDDLRKLYEEGAEAPIAKSNRYDYTDNQGRMWEIWAEDDFVTHDLNSGVLFAKPKIATRIDIIYKGVDEAGEVVDAMTAPVPRGALTLEDSMVVLGDAAESIYRDFPYSEWFYGKRATTGRKAFREVEGPFGPGGPKKQVSRKYTQIDPARFGRKDKRPVKYEAVGEEKGNFPLGDVLENPHMYRLSPKQQEFADYFGKIFSDFAEMGPREGVNFNIIGSAKDVMYFSPRKLTGFMKEGKLEELSHMTDNYAARAGTPGFMKSRAYEEMVESLKAGNRYADVYDTLGAYASTFYREVARNRLEDWIEPLTRGKRGQDMFPTFFKGKADFQKMMNKQVDFSKELHRFITTEGQMMNPKTVRAMKDAFKPLKGDADDIIALKKSIVEDVDVLLRFRHDNWKNALNALETSGFTPPIGATYKQIREALLVKRGQVSLRGQDIGAAELRQVINKLEITTNEKRRLTLAITKQMGKQVRLDRKEELQGLLDKMEEIVPGSKKAYRQLGDEAKSHQATAGAADFKAGEYAGSKLFPNKIFTSQLGNDAKAAALDLDKFVLDDGGGFILRNTANANAALRFFKTTFDIGAPLIHGLPVLFRNPEAWGKATAMHFRAFADKGVRARYIADNAEDVAEFLKYGMHIGSTEMTQAMTQGGWLARIPNIAQSALDEGMGRMPYVNQSLGAQRQITRGAQLGGRTIGYVASGAQSMFETYLDVARIEMFKGLKQTAMRSPNPEKAMTELAAFTNKVTGVTSSRGMGIGATQRRIEASLLMFSPQYTRATAALFMDITTGGLRGDQARKAIASLFAGQVALHAAISSALGEEMHLMPGQGDFLKTKLPGTETLIGFGGKGNALANMAGDVAVQGIENPGGFMNWKLWSQDTYDSNTTLKRLRYQLAPIAGEAISWVTGADPIGRSLPDLDDHLSNPMEITKYLGDKTLPFWADAMFEGGDFRGMAAIGEFGGGVTMPVLPYMKRDEIREKLISEEYGNKIPNISWDKFKQHPRFRTMYAALKTKYPELQEAEDRVEEESKHFERNTERVSFQAEASDIRKEQITGIQDDDGTIIEAGYKDITREFHSGSNGARSGEVFREKMRRIDEAAQARNRDLKKKYPKLIGDREEYFEGEGLSNKTIAATNELFDFISSDRAKDVFGNPDHSAIEKFKAKIADDPRYGPEVAAEMKQLHEEKMLETPDGVDLPELVIEYYKSWRVLEPFWNIYQKVVPKHLWREWEDFANQPEGRKAVMRSNPMLADLEKMVKEEQNLLRSFPQGYEIDKYLTMFYDYAPVNPRRQFEIERQQARIAFGA
jgi:hypothetical protein